MYRSPQGTVVLLPGDGGEGGQLIKTTFAFRSSTSFFHVLDCHQRHNDRVMIVTGRSVQSRIMTAVKKTGKELELPESGQASV